MKQAAVFPRVQAINPFLSVAQGSSRAANSRLLRRDCCFRSSLPGRADNLCIGDADPAERTAGSAPKPALRYQLLPELKEMQPGNPIQHYMKTMMEQNQFFFDEAAFQRREKLLTVPLAELPVQELEDYGRFALIQADWAARLDNPDWQTLLKLRADGIVLLLPEVQQIRSLSRALQVRFRAEIAQCRFDDAIRTAKTLFAMSRHLGEHPTLIADLVGIAIASVAASGLEEMQEQPGCPNLYWALTTLPSPLIPLDKGMDGERVMHQCLFRDLSVSVPMTGEQIKKFIAHMDKMLVIGEGPPQSLACGRGWTLGPRTMQWSPPPATASSNTASGRSGCCGSRPTR